MLQIGQLLADKKLIAINTKATQINHMIPIKPIAFNINNTLTEILSIVLTFGSTICLQFGHLRSKLDLVCSLSLHLCSTSIFITLYLLFFYKYFFTLYFYYISFFLLCQVSSIKKMLHFYNATISSLFLFGVWLIKKK